MKNLTKRVFPIIIGVLIIGVVVFGKDPNFLFKAQDDVPEISQGIGENVTESPLIGEWYCSEINSCNNMKIFLSITQSGESLYIVRDMKSEKDSKSGSILEGNAVFVDSNSAYADFTSGKYTVIEGGYLLEYFEKMDRWNIYTKGFFDEPIEGRYDAKK